MHCTLTKLKKASEAKHDMNDIIWLQRETIHWVGWRRQSNSKWANWPPLEFTGNYKLKLTSEGWHTPTSTLITVTIKMEEDGWSASCHRSHSCYHNSSLISQTSGKCVATLWTALYASTKKEHFFFQTMTAIFTRDRTGSCFVSKLYSSTRSCINSQGQFYISPFVNKWVNGRD